VPRIRALWALDAVLALALTGSALAEPGVFYDVPRAIVLVAMTVVIAGYRRAPVAVLAAEVVGVVAVANHLDLPQGIAVLIAAYAAAFYSDRRAAVAGLLVVAAGWLLAFGGEAKIPSGLVPVLLVAPVWLAGSAMRRREQRADRLEREQDAALQAERARIARELHDVVTHSVSLMVLQAGAARQIMEQDKARSRAMLESVEASGRSALEELRRMLGLLSDEDGDAPLSPQPGVTEIPSLVEQVREAGLAVELYVEGQPRAVSGGVAIAAYRIVQEALTNVVKHADGAQSRVVLRWGDGALELEIVDRGSAGGPARRPLERDTLAGHGLAGMRERAAMYGGTLDARPVPERGFVVRARIPLETAGA
jgi:signal transduction histidine kinase